MLVVNTKTASHIDMLHNDAMTLQLVLQFVDTVAESLEIAHVQYLAADMEMKTHHLDMLHMGCFLNDTHHVTHGDAELVLCQSCRDIGMGMCSHIRVQTEGDTCHLPFLGGKLVDDLQFGNTFHVEAENVVVKTEVDLPVALSDTGEDDL